MLIKLLLIIFSKATTQMSLMLHEKLLMRHTINLSKRMDI